MRVLLACLLCLSLWDVTVTVTVAADSSCTWTEPGSGKQRFDFDQLSIQPGGSWQGSTGAGGWNSSTPCTTEGCTKVYQYFFNLCTKLDKTPTQCVASSPSPSSADAIAYQYTNGTSPECRLAGKATNPVYDLLVPNKPSQGFTVTYGGGDQCANGKDREFRVHLRCSANLPADPQLSHDNSKMAPMNTNARMSRHSSSSSSSSLSLASSSLCTAGYAGFYPDCHIFIGSVYEDTDTSTKCLYHVHVNSVFGCPSSCRSSDSSVACSGHGICAEDTDASVTRCFCDKGWGGDQCQHAVDTSSATSSRSPNTVLTVFVLILLFAALGLGYALYRKIRGFHGDFDHQYGQLGDDAGMGGKSGRGGMQINNA